MINSKLLGSIGNAVKKVAGTVASGQMGLGQAAKPPMGGSQISNAVKGAIASMPQKIVQQPGFKSMAQVAPRIASGVVIWRVTPRQCQAQLEVFLKF